MSQNKKYYYLKLKDTFFDSEEMKIIESQKNGIIYQNLYLKLCLLSLKAEGALLFKNTVPYDLAMLSTVLRIDIDTVKTGIEIFSKMGLIEITDTGIFFMSDIQTLIGLGSSEGDRVKNYRKRISNLQGVQMYENRTPELELEKEIELKKEIEIDQGAADESADTFFVFWNLYDKKVGNKEKVKKIWYKLPFTIQEKIINIITEYVKSTPDKQFRKNPETYLNGKCWENEIIFRKQHKPGEPESCGLTAEEIDAL